MTKLPCLLVLLLAAAAYAATALTKESYFQTFSGSDNSSTLPPQNPEDITVPDKALSWKNLQTYYNYGRFGNSPLFNIVIYDPYWYAGFINASKPAVITSKYRGSCVQSWELTSFAFGCNANQEYADPSGTNLSYPFPSNCTVTVEGLDRNGYCVGREVFHYTPFPLFDNVDRFPSGYMERFNTTHGGLKGKKLEKVKIGVKVVDIPGDRYTYYGGFSAGIDAVSYTVFNKSGCH